MEEYVALWNIQTPIEDYFVCQEHIFEVAMENTPEYTREQMEGKAIMSMKTCGLFPTALLKWNGLFPPIKIGGFKVSI